jgi:hypothetical protein
VLIKFTDDTNFLPSLKTAFNITMRRKTLFYTGKLSNEKVYTKNKSHHWQMAFTNDVTLSLIVVLFQAFTSPQTAFCHRPSVQTKKMAVFAT